MAQAQAIPQSSGQTEEEYKHRRNILVLLILLVCAILVAEFYYLFGLQIRQKNSTAYFYAEKVDAVVLASYQNYSYAIEGNEHLSDSTIFEGGVNNALLFWPDEEVSQKSLSTPSIEMFPSQGVLFSYSFFNNTLIDGKNIKVTLIDNALKQNVKVTYSTSISGETAKEKVESIAEETAVELIIPPQQRGTIYIYTTIQDDTKDAIYQSDEKHSLNFMMMPN